MAPTEYNAILKEDVSTGGGMQRISLSKTNGVSNGNESATDNTEAIADDDPRAAENVYKNLLITEHALRSQYMELQRSRRQGHLFLWGVTVGATMLTYRMKYCPSIYRILRLVELLLTIALYIAIGLFFLTGMYAKTFKIAPRFLSDTNKGLKALNFRLVKTKISFKEKLVRIFYDPVYVLDPAGPVKIVLFPREFSPLFIEEWELFRDEYWERQRRRKNRAKSKRRKGEKSEKKQTKAAS